MNYKATDSLKVTPQLDSEPILKASVHREREDGSAGLFAVFGCLVIVSMASAIAALASISGIHAAVDAAADLTALAVADSLMSESEPCKNGARTAKANQAELESCEISGLASRVRVSMPLPKSIQLISQQDKVSSEAIARIPEDPIGLE